MHLNYTHVNQLTAAPPVYFIQDKDLNGKKKLLMPRQFRYPKIFHFRYCRTLRTLLVAHPYPVTLTFLQQALSSLPSYIELVAVEEYLQEINKKQQQSYSLAEVNELLANMWEPVLKN
jgi:hypothetical protein